MTHKSLDLHVPTLTRVEGEGAMHVVVRDGVAGVRVWKRADTVSGEPAADLPIALAIASAVSEIPLGRRSGMGRPGLLSNRTTVSVGAPERRPMASCTAR